MREQASADPGLQSSQRGGSAGSVGVGSGRASPPPLSRFALEPQASAVTTGRDAPLTASPPQARTLRGCTPLLSTSCLFGNKFLDQEQLDDLCEHQPRLLLWGGEHARSTRHDRDGPSALQVKQAAAEAPPEVLATSRPKQRALWRFRSGGQPAQYVPPAEPTVVAAAAPFEKSPKAAQQTSPKAFLSRKRSPPGPLTGPQPPSPVGGDVGGSPSSLNSGCVTSSWLSQVALPDDRGTHVTLGVVAACCQPHTVSSAD